MKQGKELDALIAEKVMGLDLCICTYAEFRLHFEKMNYEPCPPRFGSSGICNKCGKHYVQSHPYSSSIGYAWDVVEKMQADGWAFIIDNMEDFLGNWKAHFEKDKSVRVYVDESASLAICVAALGLK